MVVLLRALTNYEAASSARLREQVALLDATVSELTLRIESLEAIAVEELTITGSSELDSESAQQGNPRNVKTGS